MKSERNKLKTMVGIQLQTNQFHINDVSKPLFSKDNVLNEKRSTKKKKKKKERKRSFKPLFS